MGGWGYGDGRSGGGGDEDGGLKVGEEDGEERGGLRRQLDGWSGIHRGNRDCNDTQRWSNILLAARH